MIDLLNILQILSSSLSRVYVCAHCTRTYMEYMMLEHYEKKEIVKNHFQHGCEMANQYHAY